MSVRMPRVAVIDDDEEFVALMQALLEEEGYGFLAPDAAGADPVAALASDDVDAAILDLHGVPDGGGLALLERIRAHPSLARLPILICSADIQLLRDHAEELVRTPAVAALEKPFRIDAFVGALERLLEGSVHPPAMGAAPDRDAVRALEAVLARIGADLRWPALDAWAPDLRPGMLRCLAAWVASRSHAAFAQVSRRTLLPFGGGLPGRIWVSGRSAWIDDLASDMNFPRLPTARRSGLVSAAAVPVHDGTELIGVLAAYDRRRRSHDTLELRRLEEAAVPVGPLLRRAAGIVVPG